MFDFLPGLYRDQDAENGGFLEKWSDGLRPLFDFLADRISRWQQLRDPLSVRTAYDVVRSVRLGPIVTPEAPIEQRGVDGIVNSSRQFTSASARFTSKDVGKRLTLTNATIPINNRTFKIASVINSTTAVCDPPLVVDGGPIRWILRGFTPLPEDVMAIETRGGDVSDVVPGWSLFDGSSEFEVFARQQFYPVSGQTKKLTLQEGSLGSVLSDGRFQAETAFTQQDVGKPFTVSGSLLDPSNGFSNNGKFEIYAVDVSTPTRLTFWGSVTIPGADANGGVTYTLAIGNTGVRVTHVVEGISTPLSVAVDGNDVYVNLQTNGLGVAISTATAVANAVNASLAASALVSAAATGTGASVAGASEFVVVPGARLLQEAGPLVWALLPFPQLQIVAAAPPLGVVEQEGVDLHVGPGGTDFSAVTARLTLADVGKHLVIRGSSLGNNGTFPIASVTNFTTGTVGGASFSTESNLTWELRTVTTLSDTDRVRVHAPSMLQYLAQDFGITVDAHESEARQRSWVENVTQWLDLKGSAKGYTTIGAVSGWNATTAGLYRVTLPVSQSLPGPNLFAVSEGGPGQSGADGALTSVAGFAFFSSASAKFIDSDEGKQLHLTTGSNQGLLTIDEFISSTEVRVSNLSTVSTPDYGPGGTALSPKITWDMVRLYTDMPPTRPLFDDVNPELMQAIVGTTHFLVDSYCWDTNFINHFDINITGSTPSTTNGVPVNITVTASGVTLPGPVYTDMAVIGAVGKWKVVDSLNQEFWVETLPVQTAAGPPPIYTFTTYSSVLPANGTASLQYICEEHTDCTYCRSNRMEVDLAEGSLAQETGLAQENALDRVISRLEDEVKPAHVVLVPNPTPYVPPSNPVKVWVVDKGLPTLFKYDGSAPAAPTFITSIDLSAYGTGARDVKTDGTHVFVTTFWTGANHPKLVIVDPGTNAIVGVVDARNTASAMAGPVRSVTFDGAGYLYLIRDYNQLGFADPDFPGSVAPITLVYKYKISDILAAYPSVYSTYTMVSGFVEASFPANGRQAEKIVYGGGKLWAGSGALGFQPDMIFRMDPTSGATASDTDAGHVAVEMWDAMYAFGSVWTTDNRFNSTKVYRFDPATFGTNAPTVITTSKSGRDLGTDGTYVWMAGGQNDATLTKIDPGSNTVGVTITKSGGFAKWEAMAYDGSGSMWIVQRSTPGIAVVTTTPGSEAYVGSFNPGSHLSDPTGIAITIG